MQTVVGAGEPLNLDRLGKVGLQAAVLQPVARMRISRYRRAGLRHQRERPVHDVHLVDHGESEQRLRDPCRKIGRRRGPQVHQRDVPGQRADDLHVGELRRKSGLLDQTQEHLVGLGDRLPMELGCGQWLEEVLELASFAPGMFADLGDGKPKGVGDRADLRLLQIEQRRVVPVADLDPHLPPGVRPVGTGEHQTAAGNGLHHPKFDLTGTAVAGRPIGLHPMLHVLAEEALLLQAELLGHFQHDFIAAPVVVDAHVDGHQQHAICAQGLLGQRGHRGAVQATAKGDHDGLGLGDGLNIVYNRANQIVGFE